MHAARRVDLTEGIGSGVLSHFPLICLHLPFLLAALLVWETQAPTRVPLSPAPVHMNRYNFFYENQQD